MPGILPMKVIKMGSSAQSRIAQACDRCRSKKIRCDGIRPCCTQCANVGFECKTSDKLSRRAFPRGYTESLEERVRALEAEVKDLKDLLDERDEKIEVLSRIHSFSSPRHKGTSFQSSPSPTATVAGAASQSPRSTTSPTDTKSSLPAADAVITLPQRSKAAPNTPFAGPSSVRAFSSTLTARLEERGVSPSSFSTKSLTAFPTRKYQRKASNMQSPPRLVSDQLVNIYFQEWAALYPVVHRPTILRAYDRYLADPTLLRDQPLTIIQLNLIFSIAALSSKSRTNQDPKTFEHNWYAQLELLCGHVSVPTVQCMVLAQIYFLIKGDYQSLIRYRALSISAIQSLGLNQSQEQSAFDTLTTETRKKVLWCQYVLDRFAAAVTGLPVMLLDDHISTELPADVDDENVTEDGYLPGLPDESTRMSSALALIEVSKILGRALQTLYPSMAGSQISMTKLHELSEELDAWNRGLPAHLQLIFIQDKPSTNVTGSRSPLLSLVYYYIRTLIHRPAACFGDLNVMHPAILTVCDASKHIIQILQLLDERRLSLSLALNRLEIVYLSGLGLMWQNMHLERGSKLVQDSRKMISAAKAQLESESTAAATEFRTLFSITTGGDSTATQESQTRSEADLDDRSKKINALYRRKTISNCSPAQKQPQNIPQRVGAMDPPQAISRHKSFDLSQDINVDYYPVNVEAIRSMSCTDVSKMALSAAEWECILSDLDHGSSNIFNGIYGGQDCASQQSPHSSTSISGYSPQHSTSVYVPVMQQAARLSPHDTASEAWSACSSGDMSHMLESVPGYPSDNGLGGTDDYSTIKEYELQQSLHMVDPVKGIMIPSTEEDYVDLGIFEGWDHSLMA